MKRTILIAAIFFVSIVSSGQGKFRGLNWGSSVSDLKAKYPNVEWHTDTDENAELYVTEDNVEGIEAMIVYAFIENKLQIGGYTFTEEYKSNNSFYEDFKTISKILNDKYDMEYKEKWNDTRYKDEPNEIGYALGMGYVEIRESYEDDNTRIVHYISGKNYGAIQHQLNYFSKEYINSERVLDAENF